MKKKKLLLILLTFILVFIAILMALLIIFGNNQKSSTVLYKDSPNEIYKAYVRESFSSDPPDQSLFITKNGTKEFKLVDDLPGDIDMIQDITWSPDSKTVIFTTQWYLIITNVDNFNIKKVNLNPDWWKWKKEPEGSFISSNRIIELEQLKFIGSDTLEYKTNEMASIETIYIREI